jgi:hypothetical protein
VRLDVNNASAIRRGSHSDGAPMSVNLKGSRFYSIDRLQPLSSIAPRTLALIVFWDDDKPIILRDRQQ